MPAAARSRAVPSNLTELLPYGRESVELWVVKGDLNWNAYLRREGSELETLAEPLDDPKRLARFVYRHTRSGVKVYMPSSVGD